MIDYDSFLRCHLTDIFFRFSRGSKRVNLAITYNDFPLSKESAKTFESLKETLLNCCLSYIRDDVPFQVDCDASEHSVAAT